MKNNIFIRFLEVFPAFLSWSIILFFIILFFINPNLLALLLIVYLLFWFFRLFYMSLLLILAHHRMSSKRKIDWLRLCKEVKTDINFNDILHIVLYTIYREPQELIKQSLTSLTKVDYPLKKIVVVLAGEEREIGIREKLASIKKDFKEYFKDIIITIHPANLKGEIPAKGANATYASKEAKRYLEERNIDFKNVIISCFDADTCVDIKFFSSLTYHFLKNPKRYRTSYQPLPVYNNNFYDACGFARVIEIGSTFWQLIDSMRYEKFITFSSHSMSFKTLVEVGYWPTDTISDDSLIFWKCFVKFLGDYRTCFLDVPVYMDIAVGKNFFDTLKIQYKQKRRWAWGIECFVFLGNKFFVEKNKFPLRLKLRKLFQVLDNHINWATWSIIISFIVPLVLIWTTFYEKTNIIFFNLSYINRTILHILTFIILVSILISKEFIPPPPKRKSFIYYISFILQWFFIPFVSMFLGSFPALDAQTRMALGKRLSFFTTPKRRVFINNYTSVSLSE